MLFDIEKAYDTTWRFHIIKSLENFGLKGNLPIFIKSFLENRTFQTRVDNNLSDKYDIECGIPQGAVLSGTLFAIAINDIVKKLPKYIQKSLYVDDFAVYYASANIRHTVRILNRV